MDADPEAIGKELTRKIRRLERLEKKVADDIAALDERYPGITEIVRMETRAELEGPDPRLDKALEIGEEMGLKPRLVEYVLARNLDAEPNDELFRTAAEAIGMPVKERSYPGQYL